MAVTLSDYADDLAPHYALRGARLGRQRLEMTVSSLRTAIL